jgi:hypothetical protein
VEVQDRVGGVDAPDRDVHRVHAADRRGDVLDVAGDGDASHEVVERDAQRGDAGSEVEVALPQRGDQVELLLLAHVSPPRAADDALGCDRDPPGRRTNPWFP